MSTRSRVTCSFSASLSACLRFRWYWVTNDGSSWRPISILFAAWAGCGDAPRSAAISAGTSTAPSIRGRARGRNVRKSREGPGAMGELLLKGAWFDRTPVRANTPPARVVGGERERDRREAREEIVHEVALGVDRCGRIEGVSEAVRRGRAGHELRDALRSRA